VAFKVPDKLKIIPLKKYKYKGKGWHGAHDDSHLYTFEDMEQFFDDWAFPYTDFAAAKKYVIKYDKAFFDNLKWASKWMKDYYRKYMHGEGQAGKGLGRLFMTDTPDSRRGYRRNLQAKHRGLKSSKHLKEAELYGDSKLLGTARRLKISHQYDSPNPDYRLDIFGHYERDYSGGGHASSTETLRRRTNFEKEYQAKYRKQGRDDYTDVWKGHRRPTKRRK
jgi:hypothetical protein